MHRSAKQISAIASAILILSGAAAALAQNYSPGLQPQQGRYFQWAAPPGWQVSETMSGVTLISPDGRYSAALASVLRSMGTRSPQNFLQWVFTNVPDYGNARIVSVKPLPNEQMSYQTWQFIEAVVSYTDRGLPVTGVWKVGVANYYGINDALIVGYRAANPDFQRAQSFMPTIAKSIILTNPGGFAGNNTLVKPKNNPLDNSGLIKSGQYRDRVREHASEGWREGMMGTEPTIDPSTGKQRDTPLSDWNGARGGYVNPDRPNELLQPYHK